MTYLAREISQQINCELVGDGEIELTHVADLSCGSRGSLAFAAGAQYITQLQTSEASAVIVPPDLVSHCKSTAIVSKNPYLSFASAAQLLHPQEKFSPQIHPTSIIGDHCDIGDDVYIGPHVVIDAKCKIGSGSYIGPSCLIVAECEIGSKAHFIANVTISGHSLIGQRVVVHPGVVIGSDGFGLANDNGVWHKIPQLGKVVIGDDVEIGANTTIDRGALLDTIIEDGVKLDNQIQVAHNVKIGAHTAVAGCVGIAGSATIGKHCGIGGGAGIQGHIEIADGVQVTGMTKISQSITEPGVYTSGTAAQDNKAWLRNANRFKQLDHYIKRLQEIEKNKIDTES